MNRSSKPEKVDLPASARHAWPDSLPPFESVAWVRILAGAFPAFHAFIGFEGMLNVAEEVKNATRALPLIKASSNSSKNDGGTRCPCSFFNSGLGSNKSNWLGAPAMKMKMTLFAVGLKCGSRGFKELMREREL